MDIIKIALALLVIAIPIVFLIKKVREQNTGKKGDTDNNYMGEGIALGLVFGVLIGVLMNNIGTYAAIGMISGISIGMGIKKK